jgi:uncharacterized protein (TIGR03067 family)
MRYGCIVIVAMLALVAVSAAQDDAVRKDLDSLQGVWQCVSLDEGGKAVAEEQLKDFKLTFKGYKASHPGKDGKTEQVTIKLDPSKKPKTIDMMLLTGADKGKTLLGIYAIEEDTLKICVAQPGRDRATEFKAGKDIVLIALKREKR